MRKIVFIITVSLLAATLQPALAQGVESYLKDKSDAAVRVEVVGIPGLPDQPQTFLSRIFSLLGIRKVNTVSLPVGAKLVVNSSAYSSSPYQTDNTPCVTAAGTPVRPGVVASNFLPLGTLLDINGQNYIVEDRMNTRYAGYYLDVWFPSTSSALEFGRKKLEITVKGYGTPGQAVREGKKTEAAVSDGKNLAQENKGVWNSVRQTLGFVSQFIGARSASDVNKYDVDCLKDESTS